MLFFIVFLNRKTVNFCISKNKNVALNWFWLIHSLLDRTVCLLDYTNVIPFYLYNICVGTFTINVKITKSNWYVM